MSQGQPRKPAQAEQEPVKYGAVFMVSGEIASKPVAPKDTASAQAAEKIAFGHAQKGDPAAVMQSAADLNIRHGVLGRDAVTTAVREHGVSIKDIEEGDQEAWRSR